jgi:hypothetical protein
MMTLPFFVLPVAPLLERPRWRRALAVAGALGVLSALLGVAMYFNQYFHIAERALGSEVDADGPVYWRSLHFDPAWSPLAGHLEAVPDMVANSWARLDGRDADLAPFPGGVTPRYDWYFAPAQLDSWAYWLFPAHGPKKLLVFVPVFAAAAGAGALLLVRPPGRRSPGRRARSRPGGR